MHTKAPTTSPHGADEAAAALGSMAVLGWDDGWDTALAAGPAGSEPGRVSRIDRGELSVIAADGPLRVRASRQLQLAVGDWVTLSPATEPDGLGEVASLLPRRTGFARATPDAHQAEQVVAANIDTVLIVTAADHPLSVRHLERFVALAWHSGAVPAVAITKADLASAEQLDQWAEAITAAAPGMPVHAVSTAADDGLASLDAYLTPGRTLALVGLSGAGKSTLVNVLADAPLLTTGAVRPDGQGRHTTTHRELVVLPAGGLIIDTPGMRATSVAAAAEGVRLAFADVEAIAADCEYGDCAHRGERGCALEAAVDAGRLSATRLSDWLALAAGAEKPDRGAGRLQVLVRKRRKADAKSARRLRHQPQAPTRPVQPGS
jgi:ribosome biogenesis GTPase / thiamine phosphate phosphatase